MLDKVPKHLELPICLHNHLIEGDDDTVAKVDIGNRNDCGSIEVWFWLLTKPTGCFLYRKNTEKLIYARLGVSRTI